MINKIDIIEFGSFKDYRWDCTFTRSECFGSRNVIYGRNYSGKTTLSRIFRCVENRSLHEDFLNGDFTFTLDDGSIINQSALHNTNMNIRVYNSDFRKDNLSFLYDKKGEVLPFTILGEKNIEIEKCIEEMKVKLEVETNNLGTEAIEKSIKGELKKLTNSIKKLENTIDIKIRDKASNIKIDNDLFKASSQKKEYNKNDLINDIQFARKITSVERDQLRSLLVEESKKSIDLLKEINFNFQSIFEETRKLLLKEVKPSKSIEYLFNNSALQEWVRRGMDYHYEQRVTCAFCGQELPDKLWEKLDAHFTKEAEAYKNEIQELMKNINSQIERAESYIRVSEEAFYSKYKIDFRRIINDWNDLMEQHKNNLKVLYDTLKGKSEDIFKKDDIDRIKIIDMSDKLNICMISLNSIIEKNNGYSEEFLNEQERARRSLRYDEINKFIADIDYEDNIKVIKKEKDTLQKKIEEKIVKEELISVIKREIRELESKLNDELKAAEQVNIYLKNFLGHPELSLEVEEAEPKAKNTFWIKRNDEIAYNLSEGEQSLISFCYFLATLKDISNPLDYIVFIDDPICSLDCSNIFYIFSLLDSEIARKDYKQIFISTHNLDLLKYLQKISKPSTNKRYNNCYFVIDKKTSNGEAWKSRISIMPDYLKKYATEFIYLFEQIYIVANEEQDDENYHVFYSFPNSARKFLESYMFFKYPDCNMTNDKKLYAFFGNGTGVVALLNRINNEFSHGEDQFDRLTKPIDIPEFKNDAKLILDALKEKDNEQYKAFCSSIGGNGI